jgi:hypothetical protein
MSKKQGSGTGKLAKAEKKKISSQLCDMFGQVNPQVISRIVGSCSSFEEALDKTLQVASRSPTLAVSAERLAAQFPDTSAAERAQCLALSAGDEELAADLLSALEQHQQLDHDGDRREQQKKIRLERSVSELCEAFDLSRAEAASELAASAGSMEDAAISIIMRRSISDQTSDSQESADLEFLKAMFAREREDVLKGLLDEMKRLEDVVDFLLSLDVLLLEEALNAPDIDEAPPPHHDKDQRNRASLTCSAEEDVLQEMFPQLDDDVRLAALEASGWDINEACAVLSAAQPQPPKKKESKKSLRWQKLEAKQIRVGRSSKWNGNNGVVRECIVEQRPAEVRREKKKKKNEGFVSVF